MTYEVQNTLNAATIFRDHTKSGKDSQISARLLLVSFCFKADWLNESGRVIHIEQGLDITSIITKHLRRTIFVAESDPEKDLICSLANGPADVIVLPNASCETLAEYIRNEIGTWLFDLGLNGRVSVGQVTVNRMN